MFRPLCGVELPRAKVPCARKSGHGGRHHSARVMATRARASATYAKSEAGKATWARYMESEKGKSRYARYMESEQGKAHKVNKALFLKTEEGKAQKAASNARFRQSEAGRVSKSRYVLSGDNREAVARSKLKARLASINERYAP